VPKLTFVPFKNDGDLSFALVVFLKKKNRDRRITKNLSYEFFAKTRINFQSFFNQKYLENILLALTNIFMVLNNPTGRASKPSKYNFDLTIINKINL
jgi:hypothetical protein